MFKVWMGFEDGEYVYGTYSTREKAREAAAYVRNSRGCEVWIEEV